MKKIFAAAVMTAAFASPAVLAGSAGAGPAGNGATTIGTLTSSMTFDRASSGLALGPSEQELFGGEVGILNPGTVASIFLSLESALAIFNTLQAAEGSRVSSDGSVISSVVTLPDGRGGTILVNRSTGRLTVITTG